MARSLICGTKTNPNLLTFILMITNLLIASIFILVSFSLAINIEKAVKFSVTFSQFLYRAIRQAKLFLSILIRSYARSRQLINHSAI